MRPRLAWITRQALRGMTLLLASRCTSAQDIEVPFITTPDHVTLAMLELAGTGPNDVLIDLGSGDGRIVITAARRFGARGLGVEIVPELVARSRAAAHKAGVAERTEFRVQDLFDTDLRGASVITMYLLPEVNMQLRPRLLALAPGTRIVSHDWDLGDWQPDRTLQIAVPDKTVGRDKFSRLHLWLVPARLDGYWCGVAAWAGQQLRFEQRHQHARAFWRNAPETAEKTFSLLLRGATLEFRPHGHSPWPAMQASEDGRLLANAGSFKKQAEPCNRNRSANE
jgi:SAM-dependent methyltransferase